MQELSYYLLDVFTDMPFGGNQLAVFPSPPKDISTAHMQQIARELNLSETVFVFPAQDPANHARLRIFTPQMELPVAGHPTVGTGYLLHSLGVLPQLGSYRLEEGVGIISIDLQADADGRVRVQMQQPVPQFGAIFALRAVLAELLTLNEPDLLETPIQVVSSGVPFLFVPVRSLEAIRRVKVRLDLWERYLKNSPHPHLFVFTPEVQEAQSTVHSRMFAPAMGITEDPATGIASGPLGAYLLRYGMVTPEQARAMVSEQGIEMGRPSFIHIQIIGTPESIEGGN